MVGGREGVENHVNDDQAVVHIEGDHGGAGLGLPL